MGQMITTRNSRVQKMVEASGRGQSVEPTQEQIIAKNWADLKKKSRGMSPRGMPVLPVVRGSFSQVVEDGAWKGRRCFIIGGGASLKDFDFSLLKNELTIGVNRAYEELDCTVMFATDAKFYKWVTEGKFGAKAKKRFDEFGGHKVWLDSARYEYEGVHLLTGLGGEGISSSMKTGIKSGGNSGYGALNLAVCLGANPIYLLGYDMKGKGGKQAHWHDGYPKVQPDKVYKKFKTYFESAAPILKEKGIEVINLNPDSELKCFEFGDLKEIEKTLLVYNYMECFDSKKQLPHRYDNLLVKGPLGFGDNFYLRPIIKDVTKTYKTVYLQTAFPEVYWDIPNVKFVRFPSVPLRTQKKHAESLPEKTWSRKPVRADSVPWAHLGPPAEKKIQTKYVELENKEDFDFSFPLKKVWIEEARKLVEKLQVRGKKLCIVRRPTNRREWNCPSRNPKIEYYQLLIDRYKKEYFFLGLADVKEKEEWFDGDLHRLDKEFNKGEIPLTTILGLMKIADMTITYPSLFMIAAVAVRAKCYTIYGGCAAPHYSLRKRLGLQNFGIVAPEPMCNCHQMTHKCKKDIPPAKVLKGFQELKDRPMWSNSITVGVPPGLGDSYWVMTHMESFKERKAIDELKIAVMKKDLHDYTAGVLRMFSFVDELKEQRYPFNLSGLYNTDPPKFMEKGTQGVDYFIDFGALMWKKGMNLEDIYPECETDFDCWKKMGLPVNAVNFAGMVKKNNKGKLVLFYTSSIGNNKHWNGGAWGTEDWLALASRIFEHSGIRPILIGAHYDRDFALNLRRLDNGSIIQDLVGTTDMAQIISLVKEANLVVSFPSGIPMMATYIGVPTVMFWGVKGVSRRARFDPEFQYAWVPPKARNNGRYIPVMYDSKEASPKWIFNKVKEFL